MKPSEPADLGQEYQDLCRLFSPRTIRDMETARLAQAALYKAREIPGLERSADRDAYIQLVDGLYNDFVLGVRQSMTVNEGFRSDGEVLQLLIDLHGLVEATLCRDLGMAPDVFREVLEGRMHLERREIGVLCQLYGLTPADFDFTSRSGEYPRFSVCARNNTFEISDRLHGRTVVKSHSEVVIDVSTLDGDSHFVDCNSPSAAGVLQAQLNAGWEETLQCYFPDKVHLEYPRITWWQYNVLQYVLDRVPEVRRMRDAVEQITAMPNSMLWDAAGEFVSTIHFGEDVIRGLRSHLRPLKSRVLKDVEDTNLLCIEFRDSLKFRGFLDQDHRVVYPYLTKLPSFNDLNEYPDLRARLINDDTPWYTVIGYPGIWVPDKCLIEVCALKLEDFAWREPPYQPRRFQRIDSHWKRGDETAGFYFVSEA
jgi:hypothetical protein